MTRPTRPAAMPVAMVALLMVVQPVAAGTGGSQVASQRPAVQPQPDGVLHTLRQIPEACVRLQGQFTGQAQQPYALQVVETSLTCPRRAVFTGVSAQAPGEPGWQPVEQLRVPSARCPGMVRVLDLWQLPGQVRRLPVDGQGRERVYLEQARATPAADSRALLPQWRASWQVQGQCARS